MVVVARGDFCPWETEATALTDVAADFPAAVVADAQASAHGGGVGPSPVVMSRRRLVLMKKPQALEHWS
jgi:hypothetical protein